MITIIGSNDNFLGERLAQLAREGGLRPIRSANIERITTELKKPATLVIVDTAWEAIQQPGVLRQLVNVGNITGSKVVCICPNTDEKLKKLASSSRCAAWFLRYDLETRVKEYFRDLVVTKPA